MIGEFNRVSFILQFRFAYDATVSAVRDEIEMQTAFDTVGERRGKR